MSIEVFEKTVGITDLALQTSDLNLFRVARQMIVRAMSEAGPGPYVWRVWRDETPDPTDKTGRWYIEAFGGKDRVEYGLRRRKWRKRGDLTVML